MRGSFVVAVKLAIITLSFFDTGAKAAELNKPACEALEQWATTVDPRDRYTPIAGNNTWAPKVFGDPTFAELFGKPALELTQDELETLSAHIWDCQKAATAEKRYEAQKSLNVARGMLVGRLTKVNHVAAALTEKRKAEAAAEERTAQEAKAPQQAQRGSETAEGEPSDATDIRTTELNKPACGRLEEWATTVDPRDRYTPLPGNNTWAPKAFGEPAFARLFGKPALDLTQEELTELGNHIGNCQKTATREQRYDAQKSLNATRGMLVGRLTNVIKAAEGMAEARAAQEAAENTHRKRVAAQREQERQAAENSVRNFLGKLLGQPDSPELLRDLALLRSDPAPSPNQLYTPFARNFIDYVSRWGKSPNDPDIAEQIDVRIAALREPILAEIESQIDSLPSSEEGLRALNQIVAEAYQNIGPALGEADRARLQSRAAKRQTAIRRDVTSFARQNIVNLPESLKSLETLQRWRREINGMDVTPAQRHEVAAAAQARQQEIADALLAEAKANLPNIAETLEGIARLEEVARVMNPVRLVASDSARADFSNALQDRRTAVRRGALPAFEAQLAALPESRRGLEQAEEWVAKSQAVPQQTPVRAPYVEAAVARRDAIKTILDEKDRERRQAAIDAGGDPRLVGLQFVEPIAGMSLEFRDEKMVFMNMLGIRAAGDYEVSRDDVIVNGPHGQIVLSIDGDTLQGQGLSFKRQTTN